eukprot:2365620-Rhodomonas_salina.4
MLKARSRHEGVGLQVSGKKSWKKPEELVNVRTCAVFDARYCLAGTCLVLTRTDDACSTIGLPGL